MLLDAPIPGIEPMWSQVKTGLWHFDPHATPSLPKQLLAGKERDYLTYFFTAFAHRKTAFSPAAGDEFVRAYSAAGVLGPSLGPYRSFKTSAAQNLARAHPKLPMPVLALGGQYTIGEQIVAMVQTVATAVRGGSVPNAARWLAEENPEYLLAQLHDFLP